MSTKADKGKIKIFVGKRKRAVARAIIKKGTGKVRINGVPIEIYTPEAARMRIVQTLLLAYPTSTEYDIDVFVKGGGWMGQAEAASIAIARALSSVSKRLKSVFAEFDKALISGDPRRTEPKKFGGPGPRRREQTSYR
ncbi:MAG: 30S ribosomal protein S9 [Candidatus Geothermarchaeota archaeon]